MELPCPQARTAAPMMGGLGVSLTLWDTCMGCNAAMQCDGGWQMVAELNSEAKTAVRASSGGWDEWHELVRLPPLDLPLVRLVLARGAGGWVSLHLSVGRFQCVSPSVSHGLFQCVSPSVGWSVSMTPLASQVRATTLPHHLTSS